MSFPTLELAPNGLNVLSMLPLVVLDEGLKVEKGLVVRLFFVGGTSFSAFFGSLSPPTTELVANGVNALFELDGGVNTDGGENVEKGLEFIEFVG